MANHTSHITQDCTPVHIVWAHFGVHADEALVNTRTRPVGLVGGRVRVSHLAKFGFGLEKGS